MKSFLKSLTKTEWSFEDYEIETYRNPDYYPSNVAYSAKFKNGHQTTLGATPEEAIERLRKFFEEYKTKGPFRGQVLSRPFMSLPPKCLKNTWGLLQIFLNL